MSVVVSVPIETSQESVDVEATVKKSTPAGHVSFNLLVALTLIGLWAFSLFLLLFADIKMLPNWLLLAAIVWQTFLYTGLFITAHDAMHGSVFPSIPKINHGIGSFATIAYGLFSYKDLLKKHHLHHRYPGSDRDPDFHDGEHKNPLLWYLHFMLQYSSWRQILGLILTFHLIKNTLPIAEDNLILFWAIPSILSSVQLFCFGTYLPHREPTAGYTNPHRAQSSSLPVFWSFITCYHFGYHLEHHEYPHLAWWQLPGARKAQIGSTASRDQAIG